MAGKAILTCRSNSHPFPERILILDQPVKIGRSVARARPAANNAIFDCKVLSRNHALFWYTNGKFYLQDTKSSNGTFVNDQRLGKCGEESLPREVCSGDIVQFGVDVMENNKKVTHGCIVANLKLFLPDGKEAKPSHSSSILPSINAMPVEDLYQLNIYIQEAVQREQMLESKLFALKEVLDGIREATDQGWKALIAEDRLLSRVQTLENQLQTYSKNFGEDKLKEELRKLQEDKDHYQSTAKDFLNKVLEEKLEAVQKCQEVKHSLVIMEAEYSSLNEQMEKSYKNIQDLAQKLTSQMARNEDLEAKLQVMEEQHQSVVERLERKNIELEDVLQNQQSVDNSCEIHLSHIDINEKPKETSTLIDQGLNSFNSQRTIQDLAENDRYPADRSSVSSLEKEDDIEKLKVCLEEQRKSKEVLDLFTAQLDLLQAEKLAHLQQINSLEDDYEEYSKKRKDGQDECSEVQAQIMNLEAQVNEEGKHLPDDVHSESKGEGKITNGSMGAFDTIQSQIRELKQIHKEAKYVVDSCELNMNALKEDLDQAKDNLSKTSGNCLIAQEKLMKAKKDYEECQIITQTLVEQVNMSQLNSVESFDGLYNCLDFSKNNLEEDKDILKKLLFEAQQVAKQSRNEAAQMMDRVKALTAELESRGTLEDNKIQEELEKSKEECYHFKEMVNSLHSQIIGLKEENEKLNIAQGIQCSEQGESIERKALNDSPEELEDYKNKIKKLEEELVLIGTKYMECNEERTRLSRDLAKLKLDYQAVTRQPYFDVIFALPCILLFIVIIISFYPSLSQILGTSEHSDKGEL